MSRQVKFIFRHFYTSIKKELGGDLMVTVIERTTNNVINVQVIKDADSTAKGLIALSTMADDCQRTNPENCS